MMRSTLLLGLGATMVGTAWALPAESKKESSPYESALIDDKIQFEALKARLKVDRKKFELGERTSCTFGIVNRSSKALTVPDISLVSGKGETYPQGMLRCLQHQVLKIVVTRDGQPIETHDVVNRPPTQNQPLPTKQLQPGRHIGATFELSGNLLPHFFSIDRPGKYEVSVVLDTTKSPGKQLWRGRTAAAGTSFVVTEFPTFAAKKTEENDVQYAEAKVRFYLTRIAEHKGLFYKNVDQIFKTKEGVAALVSTLDSKNREESREAEEILQRLYAPLGSDRDRRSFPQSRETWMQWWRTRGSKMSYQELWHNFDSHSQ